MRKLFRKINLKIFAPTCLILVLLILVLLLQPVKAGQAINFLYDRCTENFGWLYLTACI